MAARRQGLAPGTMLSWHSKNHGDKVLRNAIDLLRARDIALGRVVYLFQSARQQDEYGRGVATVGRELQVEVRLRMVQLEPEQVTRHRVIYEALRDQVVPLVAGEEALHINISPGTPAMHAVWLVLHARGEFPPGTRLWSSQVDEREVRRIDEVDFAVNSYVQEIRKVQEARPELGHFGTDPQSPRRVQAHEQLLRYARLRQAPLLVVGPRGCGKTRLIEDRLPTLKGRERVVTVACGTLKPELAMSLLFGHVRGAFTGADRDQPGYLQEADGQILLLDEVQDLPREVQRQLVRVLQDPKRRYRRLGETREQTANVELVCASHLPLEELRSRLDADLFDRLSLLIIEWPPLAECREDLRQDFGQVWRELSTHAELGTEPPDELAMWAALQEDGLPGNLRDLQRLAYLLMTWHGKPRWVSAAVDEWRLLQRRLLVAERGSEARRGSDEIRSRSWKEHTHQFQRELAQEARDLFGSYEAAAEALKTSDRTLRDAARRT